MGSLSDEWVGGVDSSQHAGALFWDGYKEGINRYARFQGTTKRPEMVEFWFVNPAVIQQVRESRACSGRSSIRTGCVHIGTVTLLFSIHPHCECNHFLNSKR